MILALIATAVTTYARKTTKWRKRKTTRDAGNIHPHLPIYWAPHVLKLMWHRADQAVVGDVSSEHIYGPVKKLLSHFLLIFNKFRTSCTLYTKCHCLSCQRCHKIISNRTDVISCETGPFWNSFDFLCSFQLAARRNSTITS